MSKARLLIIAVVLEGRRQDPNLGGAGEETRPPVGSTTPETGETTLLRWDLTNRRNPDAFPSAQMTPTAISPHGVIGGVVSADDTPALVVGHALVPLPQMVPAGAHGTRDQGGHLDVRRPMSVEPVLPTHANPDT